ncbi:MAG: DUF861 domain-containing protein [Chloroflexi bacterium]|nr:DUF861 domain-containing protein [Chloroflexota bacterium]
MKKRFLTADEIRARKAEGLTQIALQPGERITPLALDTARELGLEIHSNGESPQPSNGSGPAAAQPVQPVEQASPAGGDGSVRLEGLVRQVVEAVLARMADGNGSAEQTPVKRVAAQSVQMQPFPFEINRPEMDVQLVDVITAEHGSPMAAGFLSFHKGSFPWTLNYDEIEFVLEGEIHIGTAQGTVIGKPGDVLYIPKGTQITFGTNSWAKILYVTYPAEWAG